MARDENYEDRLRREIENTPFSTFTVSLDPASMPEWIRDALDRQMRTQSMSITVANEPAGTVTIANPTVTGVDASTTTDTYTVTIPPERRPILRVTTAPNTAPMTPPPNNVPGWGEWVDPPMAPNDFWVGGPLRNPVEESPFTAPYLRRLIREGLMGQSIDIPEGAEMLKEGQIEELHDKEKEATLEFRIRGPRIPLCILPLLEDRLRLLDLEIKRAMIRAFTLQQAPERKRTLIVDEE